MRPGIGMVGPGYLALCMTSPVHSQGLRCRICTMMIFTLADIRTDSVTCRTMWEMIKLILFRLTEDLKETIPKLTCKWESMDSFEFIKVKSLSHVWLFVTPGSSLPGSSIHGIFRVRILEWVVISFSKWSSRHRDRNLVSCTAGRLFSVWATRESPKCSF